MSIISLGRTMPSSLCWGPLELQCFNSLKNQINTKFYNRTNLVINLTWFGPQFLNSDYYNLNKYLNTQIDNLFLISSVDPIMILPEQINEIVTKLGNPIIYQIGNFDNGLQFNFFSTAVADNFNNYHNDDIVLKELKWIFLNYNRKPREHRVKFVRKVIDQNLSKYGVVTIGKPDICFDNDPNNDLHITVPDSPEQLLEYEKLFLNTKEKFGIVDDVLTLGNLDIWKHHFLNVISETEFNPWDNIFVSEKTWKPIIGLRPFLFNGNVRTYRWLRDNGFRTFSHYFDNIETAKEFEVHDSLISAIKYLISLNKNEILSMYNDMLPDLIYNKERFFEFAQEQKYKMENLFS